MFKNCAAKGSRYGYRVIQVGRRYRRQAQPLRSFWTSGLDVDGSNFVMRQPTKSIAPP